MSDITVAVNSPSDAVNITVPALDAANISVEDGSAINVTVSPNVAFQGVTNLIDVTGQPTDNQIMIYDEDQESFVFIDLSSTGSGSGNITSDIFVTNSDEGFSHINGVNYLVTDNVSLETIITNILRPTPDTQVTLSALSPTTAGTYEVGTTTRPVAFLSLSHNSVTGVSGGLGITINNAGSGFEPIVPTSFSNTAYPIQYNGGNYVYNAASSTYIDRAFRIRFIDGRSLNDKTIVTDPQTIKIRVRHLFYGSTTELAQGASQSDIQSLYDSIVTASSSLAAEQLVDRADDYTYSNDDDKYDLEVDDTYTYYFYEASLGALTDIKMGGPQGLDADDAFLHITNGGAVSLSNGEVSTEYHVYRSRNKKAFTSGQSLYFKN